MPQLLNSTALVINGRAFDWSPQYDTPGSPLQGLGCMGDDGWYAISNLPTGWAASASGRITGTADFSTALPANHVIHIGIMGTEPDDCNEQKVWFEFELHLTVIEPAVWSKNPIFTRVEGFGLGKRAQL